jgi:Co/Zn/Cd efflux system component
MIAAGLVAVLNSGAPDLIVAGVMAALFLSSSYQILRQSWAEWRAAEAGHEDHDHDHDDADHTH